MIFVIPLKEDEEGNVACNVVDTGSDCARTNRRKLREYAMAAGVNKKDIKRFFKMMGFNKDTLGVKRGNTKSPSFTYGTRKEETKDS
jgi:hypothetical protein